MTDREAGGCVRPRLWPWLLLAAVLSVGGLLVGFVGVLVASSVTYDFVALDGSGAASGTPLALGSDEAQAATKLYRWAHGLVGASIVSVIFGAARRARASS